MAAPFTSDDDVCQGLGCSEKAYLSFTVKENQKLCPKCASGKECVIQSRKLNKYWLCERHEEFVKVYCENDDEEACHSCAIVNHKDCKFIDIDDAVKQKRRALEHLRQSVTEIEEILNHKIDGFKLSAGTHIDEIEKKIESEIRNKIEAEKEEEENEVQRVDKEADEAILKVNEQREAKKRQIREDATHCRQPQEEELRHLLEDLQNIRSKIETFSDTSRHVLQSVSVDEINKVLQQSGREFLENAPRVIRATSDRVGVVQTECDKIEQSTLGIRGVHFVKVSVSLPGRISGFQGTWECISSVKIPEYLAISGVFGCINEEEITVRALKDSTLHAINLYTGELRKVIEPGDDVRIVSCVLQNRNALVCGKRSRGRLGKKLHGCVTLYARQSDGQWKPVQDFTVPRNTSGNSTMVYADVDKKGNILAAEFEQSKIYVMEPNSGNTVHTVKLKDKILNGRVFSVASENFIIKAGGLYVIDKSGEQMTFIDDENWTYDRKCLVDSISDRIFVAYKDLTETAFWVDELSINGDIKARKIINLPSGIYGTGALRMTPMGNIVCCNGVDIFVYKENISL